MIKCINMKEKALMVYKWLYKTFNWSYIADAFFGAFMIIFWYLVFVVFWSIVP